MKRIDKAFSLFPDKTRCEFVEDYCPHDMNSDLDDMDIDTYIFQEENIDRGCRGITCDECWDKEL